MPEEDNGHGAADWNDQLDALDRAGEISVPWVRQAAAWIAAQPEGPTNGRILDVGSGPGWAAAVIAERFPAAEVIAVDPVAAAVERARERFAGNARVKAETGELGSTELDEYGPADLVWCSHAVHHLPEPIGALRQLGGLLRPNGLLALAEGGLPTRCLPGGYGVSTPAFVARLDAALSDYFYERWSLTDPAVGGDRDWPLMLEEAGLRHRESKTFVLEHQAPVTPLVRDHVLARFQLIADHAAHRLTPDDAVALTRLLDPTDPAALTNRPDLFLLTAFTLHLAEPK